MRRSLAVLATLALAAAAFAQAPVNRSANGIGYYSLQVPNPAAMVIDGSDADWGWFDPTYVITMDQFRSEQDAPMPDPSDMEITAKLAWSGEPENMWYLFVKVHDDTLDIESTDVGNPWADDCINYGYDVTDHGKQGGQASDREYYQPYVAKHTAFLTTKEIMTPSRYASTEAAWVEFCHAPYAEAAVASNPPQAVQFPIWTSDTGGDMYYELRQAVFSWRSPDGPAASTRATLSALPNSFMPFLLNVEDGDGPWVFDATIRSAEATAAGYFAGVTLLGLGDYESPTAVESSTWGRIKDQFSE
jgi:hypothetical protein